MRHNTPDACFPNNWFSTHYSGEGGAQASGSSLVLYPMKCPNRWGGGRGRGRGRGCLRSRPSVRAWCVRGHHASAGLGLPIESARPARPSQDAGLGWVLCQPHRSCVPAAAPL
jgi:hypothetical protein